MGIFARVVGIAALIGGIGWLVSDGDSKAPSGWSAVKKTAVACRDREMLDRMHRLIASGDDVALRKAVIGHAASGECVFIDAGAEVFIERAVGGNLCLRPRGETGCRWASAATMR